MKRLLSTFRILVSVRSFKAARMYWIEHTPLSTWQGMGH